MLYLAVQTFSLLATASTVFFGLGYLFHRKFGRAFVEEYERPVPVLSPEPVRRLQDDDVLVKDLKRRLSEMELALQRKQEECSQIQATLDEKTKEHQEAMQEVERLGSELVLSQNHTTAQGDRVYELERQLEHLRQAPQPEPIDVAPYERKIEELQDVLQTSQREFDEKVQALERAMDSLRVENEMALAAADEAEEGLDPEERDAIVDALWKADTDPEKDKLRHSVKALQALLQEREKAIEELETQLKDVSKKLDPELVGPDNLELIKGIGPYVRELLATEFGVVTFEQVARLDRVQIERISKRLFFKDKIQREDWLGQALFLHHKKYNEWLDLNHPPYPLRWVG